LAPLIRRELMNEHVLQIPAISPFRIWLYDFQTGFTDSLKVIWKNRLAAFGLCTVILLVSVALLTPLLAPHDPLEMSIKNRLATPTADHLLGTDIYGRDILSRIMYGARITMTVATGATVIACSFGVLIGAIAGFFGGKVDAVLMRLMDAILAFPGTLLAITLVAALGQGLFGVFIAIGSHSIPSFSRIVRGSVLSQKEKEYVEAARMVGDSERRILFSQILPNCMSPIFVKISLEFATAILIESSLSFLGLGVPPPAPSWGLMLSEARGYMEVAPLTAIFPGVTISLAILGFNLVGDGLRDVYDPRLSESGK
jgi:ABC-type dipeptide/oligopeptide/nickel transport system permease subunit